jgi:MoaA/NifB/PqqE/SkfB family radical SAM enzyme
MAMIIQFRKNFIPDFLSFNSQKRIIMLDNFSKSKIIDDYFDPGEITQYRKRFEFYAKSRFYRRLMNGRAFLNRLVQTIAILKHNTYLFPHLVKNYLRLGQGGAFRSLEIAVDYNCNSKCEQCSCRLAYDPSRTRLSLDQFKDAIDQAMALGGFQFNITGGEPLVQLDEVLALTFYIHGRGGYVHLCSNGLLMNEEILTKLVAAGLNSLEMGLDSVLPSVHDDNRQEEGFNKIMAVIDLAHKFKLPVILNTIITHLKIENGDMLALYKLAKAKKVLLQITPPCVTGAWSDQDEILLDEKETLYFWWLMSFPGVRTDMYSSLTRTRCPAAREKIGLQPYGDVVSCSLIQLTFGNIKDESLAVIRDRMLQDEYYQNITFCLPAFDRQFIKDRLANNKEESCH